MPLERSLGAVLVSTAILAVGCGSADDPAAPSSSTSGGGGAGGALEPVPPLDPAACPVTPGSGVDPDLALAAEAQWSAAHAAPESGSIQQDKAFFLATLLADGVTLDLLTSDPTLAAIGEDRDQRLRDAPAQCAADPTCYAEALTWSDPDAAAAADALHARLATSGELEAFAGGMRASGRFALHATQGDAELVKTSFRDLVTALGATFAAEASSLGGSAFAGVVEATVAAHPSPLAFFEPLLEIDLAALAADTRDEASRYEPLDQGENAEALARVPSIDWAAFPFTVILVPGRGPDQPGLPLDPTGQARCDLAAARFAAGIAPLIAVSGGHVHPDRTPYSEAIEMKRYLLEVRGVPEEAVLVDPHARHTTTNLRNVSRLLYRYGVPTDRPLLVTSDLGQSLYIGYWSNLFGPRCEDELGYLPWRSLVPVSQNDACMVPVAVSLHGDGRDPLDP